MLTDRDGRDFVIRALDGCEQLYNVDAIVQGCHEAAGGWDFERIGNEEFWRIVAQFDNAP